MKNRHKYYRLTRTVMTLAAAIAITSQSNAENTDENPLPTAVKEARERAEQRRNRARERQEQRLRLSKESKNRASSGILETKEKMTREQQTEAVREELEEEEARLQSELERLEKTRDVMRSKGHEQLAERLESLMVIDTVRTEIEKRDLQEKLPPSDTDETDELNAADGKKEKP